jgi:hypothetical protein
VFRLRPVVTVGVMMMRFVVNAVMVMMTLMVLIAPGVPWTAGLCRRKRSGEDDHSECNFHVHDVSFRLFVLSMTRAVLPPDHAIRADQATIYLLRAPVDASIITCRAARVGASAHASGVLLFTSRG